MELSSDLIREFAKNTKDEPTINQGATVYGTFRVQDGINYVQIDGSDTRTPVASTITAKNGDRVTVLIKDHSAIVTGNLEDPSASSEEVEEVKKTMGQSTLDIEDLKQQLANQEITLDEYREAIADAKRMATDYIDFSAGTGLVIGSTSISSNVRIYSGGIDIRDGNTILASYTDDRISIGVDDSSAIIDMCSGTLEISTGARSGQIGTIIETSKNIMWIGTSNYGFLIGAATFGNIEVNGILEATIVSDSITSSAGYSYITYLDGYDYYANKEHTHSGSDIRGGYPSVNSIYLTSPGTASQVAIYRSTNSGILGIPSSSKRYKNSIDSVKEEELRPERLYDLPVRQFKWNEGHYPEEEHYDYNLVNIGFIAEEVAEHYPFAAVVIDGKIETWEVRGIIPPMLALIQQQKQEIDILKDRIDKLEGKEVA